MKNITLILCLFAINFGFSQIFLDENFDTEIPNTWTITDGGDNTNANVDTWFSGKRNGASLNGTNAAIVNSDQFGNGGNRLTETLTSPSFDASSAESLFLEFKEFYNDLNNQPDLARVEVFDGANWVTILEHSESNTGSFSNPAIQTISISQYKNANMQIRFFYDDSDTWAWYWLIDDVKVYGSSCAPAVNLSVSNVTANQATLNWQQGNTETQWEVAIVPTNAGPPASGTILSNTTYINTFLGQNTNYTGYVRAVCGANNASEWITINFATPTTPIPITFTSQIIAGTRYYDRGLVDMNGDYLDDLVTVDSNSNGDDFSVFYQLPSGGFNKVDITPEDPPTNDDFNEPYWSMVAGDFNHDGYNDLIFGGGSGVTFMRSKNNGTQYTEITGSEYVFSQRSNFIDINNDGDLDAFVCHDVDPNVYYFNDGSGNLSFRQGISAELPNGLGTHPGGGNYATLWVDYDNDGDMDMYIAKCRGGSSVYRNNELWRNDGNGVFTNVADVTGWYNNEYPGKGHNNSSNLGDPLQTWSAAWGDYDNDGDFDVYVGASSNTDGPSKLMRNNGDGTFTDITATSIPVRPSNGIENIAVDFDNDGYIDIFSNGDILFNNGNGTFTLFQTPVPPSGAIGDANNDGFLDVFVNDRLYTNNANGNNWVKITLEGNQSNSNGIGARIELHTPSGTQIREVRAGEGFRYANTLNVHFGLGSETTIDQIVVHWPTGGTVDYVTNATVNSTVHVEEGQTLAIQDETLIDLSLYPNPVKDQLTLKTKGDIIGKTVTIFDLNGKVVLNQNIQKPEINVSQLQSGMYLLQIEYKGKLMTRKFLKE